MYHHEADRPRPNLKYSVKKPTAAKTVVEVVLMMVLVERKQKQ